MKDFIKEKLAYLLELVMEVVIIFGIVMVIQTWIIAPFEISGASMCDTLNVIDGKCESQEGERIIINEALYLVDEPKRGDIVVFKVSEDSDKYFIKRVIGLPGETVELQNGEVFISNDEETVELEEPYLNEQNRGNTGAHLGITVFEVPEDHYFMMGDNRQASTDSRSCFAGTLSSDCARDKDAAFVHKDSIRGKAWFVWWPIENWRVINHPDYAISESFEEK